MPARTHRPRLAHGRRGLSLGKGWQGLLFLFTLHALLLRALIPVGGMPAMGAGGIEFVLCTGMAPERAHAPRDPAQSPQGEHQARHPCAFLGFGPVLAGAAPVPPGGGDDWFGLATPIRSAPGRVHPVSHERPPATGPPARLA